MLSSAAMILVALDGSSRASAVLTHAVALARALGEPLVLMRAVGLPAEVPQDLWRTNDAPLTDILSGRAQVYLDERQASIPPSVRGGTHVVVGAPWQAICEAARTLKCSLIVLGSHGYSGIDRVLGTTAAKVVNHAHCSVLVVRDLVDDPS